MCSAASEALLLKLMSNLEKVLDVTVGSFTTAKLSPASMM
jgi:hypothetical protein